MAADRSRHALDALARITELAASSVGPQDALGSVALYATGYLGADQGTVALYDESTEQLVLAAASGALPEVPIGSRVPVGGAAALLASGRAMVYRGGQPGLVHFFPRAQQPAWLVAAPMRFGGKPRGLVMFAIMNPSAQFTPEDLRTIQTFADAAAPIANRARTEGEAGNELALLAELGQDIPVNLSLDELLQRALDEALALTHSSAGFACLFDPATQSVTRGVFRGVDKTMISAMVARAEVLEAVRTTGVTVSENTPSLGAVGLKTSKGLLGVIVSLIDPSLIPVADKVLRVFGRQVNKSLEARELYREVERARAELQAVISGVATPILVADGARRLAAANPSAELAFGIASTFFAGEPIQGRLGNEQVENLLMGTGRASIEVVVGDPPRPFRARSADVTIDGNPIGRIVVMDDLSAEREISSTQRNFVAMIGHELRTPLTLVKGYARTLLKKAEQGNFSPEEMYEALRTIDARAAQLERLIEDLLHVSKIETREAKLRLDRVRVPDMIRAAAEDQIHEHSGREVRVVVPADLEWVCDETKVGLVVRHLIENALKYSEPPAEVVVAAGVKDNELIVEVQDRGIGIVSTDIPHIFDRFRQLDGSSTRSHGGTGIGLYLCAQLIHMHGGRIWVDSIWGKGSTFFVGLPRRTPTGDSPRPFATEPLGTFGEDEGITIATPPWPSEQPQEAQSFGESQAPWR